MAGKKAPPTLPWAQRHAPRHLGEVIGNTDQVRKVAEWLRDWDDVVLRGKVKEAPAVEAWRKFTPEPENINARAILVSGPPGIGKTTTCVLVAKCNPNYTLMEFNASDARGKKVIEQMSSSLAGNNTLNVSGNGKGALERSVIIMDECDGMSSGDAGGMAAMMNMIKVTKNPIICICNERGDQAVRNLASVCYDIKFRRPENIAVAKRIKHIMEGEGKIVDVRQIEAVVEACGTDIRHIINQTQFFGSVSTHGGESQKDTQAMLSPFDACQKLLISDGKKSKMPSMEKRLDMFYLDAEMMPLMIQENYLRSFEKRSSGDDDLELAAQAAELIALGDSMSGNWEVFGSAAVLSTIYPAFLAAEPGFTRPAFPLWLQKKGASGKAQRAIAEMHGKIRGSTSITIKDLASTSYHDVLYKRLLKPLQYGAVKEAAKSLFKIGLGRDFFTEQAPTLRKPLLLEDMYTKIEGKHKTQLLQEMQALVQAAAPAVTKRKSEGQGPAKLKSRKPADDPGDAEEPDGPEPDDDGADGGERGWGKKSKKSKKSKTTAAACSLGTWIKVEVELDENGVAVVPIKKDPLLIVKFLDGHTCAVRRQVHIHDVLNPWQLF